MIWEIGLVGVVPTQARSRFFRPSPSLSAPVRKGNGRADEACKMGLISKPWGSWKIPLSTTRWRSSKPVGPNSPLENCRSGVIATALPLYEAVARLPQEYDRERT